MEIYASYGVLAHEGHPVFTIDRPVSDIYDRRNVDLPTGWECAASQSGETLIVDPDGKTWPSSILTNYRDHVCLSWYDGHVPHRIILD